MIYVMQGFAGYPLTAIMLQREGKTLLARYRSGEQRPDDIAEEHAMLTVGEEKMPRLFSKIPLATTATTLNSCGWRWSAVWHGLSPTSRSRS